MPRDADARPHTDTRWKAKALWVFYTLLIIAAVQATLVGVRLRHELYVWSDPIRFTWDITNGWNWGRQAAKEGTVELYDRLVKEQAARPQADYQLDYPPARTWLVARWAEWTSQHFPKARRWQRDYEFSRPMLWGNNLAEWLSGLAVMLIIRRQILRGGPDLSAAANEFRRGLAAGVGMLGGALLWFDVGVLFDAHVFPQWDMWIMPPYLFAVLAVMYGRWYLAGVLLGMGMLLKGQLLWGAPVLVLWPAFAMEWRKLADIVLGIASGLAALTWLWLVRGGAAYAIVCGVFVLALAPVVIRRRWRLLYLPFGLTAVAALLCGWFVGGSYSWFTVGFFYGAGKFPVLFTGGTSNLCTILQQRWGFRSPTELLNVPLIGPYPLRTVLATIFAIALLLCAWGAAVHWKRRDSRLLVALCAPFVLFYALMPQMHDRYLVWGAAATALLVGVGVGMTFLHLAISFIMWAAVTWNLAAQNPSWWPAMTRFVRALHVDVGYGLLVLAAVLVYLASPLPMHLRRPVREQKASEATKAASPTAA